MAADLAEGPPLDGLALLKLFRQGVDTGAVTDTNHEGEVDPSQPGPAREAQSFVAAANSVDAERFLPGESESEPLMPGEEPTSEHVEDAMHWLNVYSELLDFKRFMLDGATKRANEMQSEEARQEVEQTDLRVARAEAERFARRLAYWRGRLDAVKAKQTEAAAPADAR